MKGRLSELAWLVRRPACLVARAFDAWLDWAGVPPPEGRDRCSRG